ncbi:MAG: hypothetical protein ACRDD7_09420, partial [Peptostreptococcaceae bacterium]
IMDRIENKKALEVIAALEERTGETVAIYKGSPNAKTMTGYHAYLKTKNGFQAVGDTWGILYRSSKSVDGLLEQ